jgi:hypothetical protein
VLNPLTDWIFVTDTRSPVPPARGHRRIPWLDHRFDLVDSVQAALTAHATIGSSRASWVPRVLFGIVVIGFLVHDSLQFPQFVLGGQMWAEMGTNYFPAAHSASLVTRLFAPDFGYIPLPQRLLGTIGSAIGLSASTTAYFYTFSALALGALLVGVICLPRFRSVIPSDGIRFVLAVLILAESDFESRTFLNFTYFGAIVLIFVTSLAFLHPAVEVPRWAYALPVLFLAKPALLCLLPAMVLVALASGRRFRIIALLSTALGLVQVASLVLSAKTGAASGATIGLAEVWAGLRSAVMSIGRYVVGPAAPTVSLVTLLVVGMVALVAFVALAAWARTGATIVTVVALAAIALSALLNASSFVDLYAHHSAVLATVTVNRVFTIAIWSVFVLVAAAVAQLLAVLRRSTRRSGSWEFRMLTEAAAILAVVGVFTATGWSGHAVSGNQYSDLGSTSQWHQQSGAVDHTDTAACVALEPLGWAYTRGCSVLNPAADPVDGPRDWHTAGRGPVALTVPSYARSVTAFAIFVQAGDDPTVFREKVTGTVRTDSGSFRFAGSVPGPGGLMQVSLPTKGPVRLASGDSVRIDFDGDDVSVGWPAGADPTGTAAQPLALWLGVTRDLTGECTVMQGPYCPFE